METLIRGASVFYSSGAYEETSVWIRDQKIVSVRANIKIRSWMNVIEASGYAIFPGFISEYSMSSYVRNTMRYQSRMLQLLNVGFTTFIDTIRWNPNITFRDMVLKHIYLHHQSPLDYTFRLLISTEEITPSIVKEASSLNVRQIIISVNNRDSMLLIDWESIFTYAKKYGVSLKLCPHISYKESEKSKKMIDEIANYWYYLNNNFGRIPQFEPVSNITSTRKLPILDFQDSSVKHFSLLPAKKAGIHPQKGCIAVGSDADLIFVPLSTLTTMKKIIPKVVILRGEYLEIPLTSIPNVMGGPIPTVHSKN